MASKGIRVSASVWLVVLGTLCFTTVIAAQRGGSTGSQGTGLRPVNGPGDDPSAYERGPVVAPRDTLTISVFGVPAFSGKFPVDLDGTFEYPQLGRIKAGGRTVRELEADLVKRLAEGWVVKPQVTIDLEQIANKQFSITGAVRAPGVYTFAGEIRLVQAIVKAGSTTEESADQAVIQRTNGDVIRVDLNGLLNGASVENNVLLRDGDLVFVNRADPVFVTGYVRSPGQYSVRRGTTVREVLALAGGISELGNPDNIEVIRLVKGTKSKPAKIKLTDSVQPGDTLEVKRRRW